MNKADGRINYLNRIIIETQDKIDDLSDDFRIVKSRKAIKLIGDEIKSLERFKERWEFELWKLEKEEL